MNQKCTKCKVIKHLEEFQKNSRYASGYVSWCKSCKNKQARTKKYGKIWSDNNPEASKAIKSRYVESNGIAVLESKRKWSKANPGKVLAKVRKYQVDKIQATPSWLTEGQLKEIEQIYINRPEGYHVDHDIPLRGKEVRGLHVPWNLKYLPASVNRRKSNKVA